MNLVAILYSE